MKKAITAIACTALAALALTGCDKAAETIRSATPIPPAAPRAEIGIDDEHNSPNDRARDNRHDGERTENPRERRPISGVQRRFRGDIEGYYTVEYIHSPRGEERDETLDYKLELLNDNTFTLAVVSDGISSSHYGHWYMRHGNITMFYDEPIADSPHNVYIADSLYGEMLHGGKIMIYDNCNIIVLARETDDTDIPSAPDANVPTVPDDRIEPIDPIEPNDDATPYELTQRPTFIS